MVAGRGSEELVEDGEQERDAEDGEQDPGDQAVHRLGGR